MNEEINYKKQRISEDLEDVVDEAQELAEEFGLNPRPVKYWINDNDEINQLAAYGGFQTRFPHWRWGMKYDKQQKQSEYGGGKIFEMVINDDPCHAYLQMSNSLADQKAVITHVEAHSDFFANNQWYDDDPQAADMMERHARKIEEYMNDPDISREEVEKWIDHVLCLEDNIDQHAEYIYKNRKSSSDEEEEREGVTPAEELGIREEIAESVFDDDSDEKEVQSIEEHYVEETETDILAFLMEHGKQYDESKAKAVEFEDWQVDILEMLREEAYYFAPQKMTKCMNEGWAAIFESWMMANEEFADPDDLITYADHQSRVLNSPGFNPYKLGKALWEHIENTVNRREVVDKLLRIEGVEPNNFHRKIDFDEVHKLLDRRDSDDIVERNYSLTRPHNQGFVRDISRSDLKKINRYIMEREEYSNVSEALSEVDYDRGWERMREVRETHNDIMFIDEFLTQEFVDDQQYYTYEYRAAQDQMQVASQDVEDVKKKLLLQFTNFGKPTIEAASANYNNSGELLLLHQYNGVVLNIDKAKSVLERIYELWGRPVNIATVGKSISEEEMDYAMANGVEPDVEEVPIRFRYDGVSFDEFELEEEIAEEIKADEVDYDTKPDDWL